MLYALIAICGILSFLAIRSSYYPLKWTAGFAWWGLTVYWMANAGNFLTKGEPTDVVFMLLFIMLGILFMLWGVAGRKGTFDIEEEISSTGSLVKRIIKSTRNSPNRTQQGESLLEYRDKVRKAARGNKARRR